MEILQLQYFLESAKTENFAKTAEKHFVPTSAVSSSIRRLEQELGCKLFDRSSNRLSLNQNGKRFYQAVQIAHDEVSQAIRDLSQSAGEDREIRMLVRAMRGNITEYVIAYNRAMPHVRFKIHFDTADRDFEAYDIIIDEKNDNYPDRERLELCHMRLRLTTSSSNPLCRRKLTLRQLAHQPFISLGETSSMHKLLVSACNRAGFTPDICMVSNDMKYYEKLVESGIGIGIERHNPKSLQQRDIAYLDVADFNEESTVFAYYKKTAPRSNLNHFLQFLSSKDFL